MLSSQREHLHIRIDGRVSELNWYRGVRTRIALEGHKAARHKLRIIKSIWLQSVESTLQDFRCSREGFNEQGCSSSSSSSSSTTTTTTTTATTATISAEGLPRERDEAGHALHDGEA